MKNRNRSIFALALLLSLLAISTITRAAEPRYRLIDLGSLGGHRFNANFSGVNGRLLGSDGTVVGGMATADADAFGWDSDGLTSHAFEWQSGSLTDLGATAFNDKANFSQAFWLNDLGHSVGIATYNASDPAVPLFKAVQWKDRRMIDLGTLGGNQSYAHAINNRDQAVGWALDTVVSSEQIWSDYPFPFSTQQRAALWENGLVRDLGTLGGACAWALGINDAGQIIGQSLTDITTGAQRQVGDWHWARPVAGFIWQNGAMADLGNLGGTWVLPLRINRHGQVIGFATGPGDSSFHPFLWDQGIITDLGTLGGINGSANDMNDAGEVVGGATLSGGGFHAFLWKDGVMKDLGSVRQRSQAWHINSKSQIVGTTGDGSESSNRAFLWENGGPMVDLNTLIPDGSPLTLRYPLGINDIGEILCYGVLPNGDSRPALLIPVPVVAGPAGKLVGWGYNEFGQTNVPPGNDFAAIAAGQYHALALRSDGSLAGWGLNYGHSDLESANIFYGQATVPAGNGFKAIAAGVFHSLALRTNGSLVGWGSNEISGNDPTPTGQATVPAGNDFVAIAAGNWHSLALKSNGSLVAWGDNSEGQTNVPAGNGFVAIAAGDFHNLALKADGSIVAWGYNFYGQTNVPPGTNFVTIASSWQHNLALKSDGSMVGWGANWAEQATAQPGTNFVAVAAGLGHSLALTSDGSMIGWGANHGGAETGDAGVHYGQAVARDGTDFIATAASDRWSLAIQGQPPVLTIARTVNNVVLSWSIKDTGYTLETKDDLSPLLNWSNVPGAPTIVGNQFTVTETIAGRSRFYRLKR